jgi:hypothetical protein
MDFYYYSKKSRVKYMLAVNKNITPVQRKRRRKFSPYDLEQEGKRDASQ